METVKFYRNRKVKTRKHENTRQKFEKYTKNAIV